jgi:hypothetical protein
MRLKWWVVVLAMLLALGCSEEKTSAGGSEARDTELRDNLNATPAGSEAGERDAENDARMIECRKGAEGICAVFSKRNSPPHTPEQKAACVARKTIEYCEEKG